MGQGDGKVVESGVNLEGFFDFIIIPSCQTTIPELNCRG